MKVVVGLGNPGAKYRGTRHNVGFDLVDELARRHAAPKPRKKFDAEISEIALGTEKTLLVCPQTFMNLSGRSVQPLVDFYGVELTDLLVVCDDLNLDPGRLRLRKSGSAGGQKGLDDIIRRLGTNEFPRLRIGIGRPPAFLDAADYVLAKIRERDREDLERAVARAADAAETWVQEGLTQAMNRFNPAESRDASDDA